MPVGKVPLAEDGTEVEFFSVLQGVPTCAVVGGKMEVPSAKSCSFFLLFILFACKAELFQFLTSVRKASTKKI